ncbi:MAG: ribbon-helix-helix protein, CopG family [Myxococcales bacterium]|nr:MAG: ribbon-helix-helix protein, CopG family [Myxococcales bacterium]
MAGSTKIAITLPDDVYDEVEKLRLANHESRSAVIQRAVRILLRHNERHARVREYVAAYKCSPESQDEVRQATALAKSGLSHVDWE